MTSVSFWSDSQLYFGDEKTQHWSIYLCYSNSISKLPDLTVHWFRYVGNSLERYFPKIPSILVLHSNGRKIFVTGPFGLKFHRNSKCNHLFRNLDFADVDFLHFGLFHTDSDLIIVWPERGYSESLWKRPKCKKSTSAKSKFRKRWLHFEFLWNFSSNGPVTKFLRPFECRTKMEGIFGKYRSQHSEISELPYTLSQSQGNNFFPHLKWEKTLM